MVTTAEIIDLADQRRVRDILKRVGDLGERGIRALARHAAGAISVEETVIELEATIKRLQQIKAEVGSS